MTNHLKDMLNNIPIPDELDKNIQLGFERADKDLRKRRFVKPLIAIAVSLILVVGIFSQSFFMEKVYAYAESKILEMSYSIGRALGIERDIEPYTNVVNQVVESKGIEMKLTEVIIDEDQLHLATIVDTVEPMDMTDFDYKIFINGKRVINDGGSATTRTMDDSEILQSTEYRINVGDMGLLENLDIRIIFTDLNYYVDNVPKRIKGKWEFEFTASGYELMVDTNRIPIDYSFNIGKEKYILDEFRFNPVNQDIYGKFETGRIGRARYDIRLQGEDNLGNIAFFYLGQTSQNNMKFRYDNYYGDLSTDAEFITLAPYIREFPEEDGRYTEEWEKIGEAFTIYFNE